MRIYCMLMIQTPLGGYDFLRIWNEKSFKEVKKTWDDIETCKLEMNQFGGKVVVRIVSLNKIFVFNS